MTKSTLQITYIGQGTTLIGLSGQYFLTDPNFSNKVLGFKRLAPPGLMPQALPELSAIIVSHAHYDHLDIFSYKYFKTTLPIIVPEGLGKFVQKFLPNPVIEIPPWSHHLQGGVEIHAVPVKHHGFRWLPLRHRASTAYVLKSKEGTVYFAGDSGPGEHFVETASLYDIDVAVLPIGGYKPKWLEKKKKLNPATALEAFRQLRAKHMIPIHWGTFNFFNENPEEAKTTLEKLVEEQNMKEKVHVLPPGRTFELACLP